VTFARSDDVRLNFYDKEWKLIGCKFSKYPDGAAFQKPENLDTMIELAEKLSTSFYSARLDM
jgi:hypothetical protein